MRDSSLVIARSVSQRRSNLTHVKETIALGDFVPRNDESLRFVEQAHESAILRIHHDEQKQRGSYTGMTNNLKRRVYEHKKRRGNTFTSRYNVNKLVYYEILADAYNAIAREKQIKAGSRRKKVELINSMNSKWSDLYDQI